MSRFQQEPPKLESGGSASRHFFTGPFFSDSKNMFIGKFPFQTDTHKGPRYIGDN
jgi:hypothetical protein